MPQVMHAWKCVQPIARVCESLEDELPWCAEQGTAGKRPHSCCWRRCAQADVQNVDGQTPSAVAQLNRELHMVKYLEEHAGSSNGKGSASKEEDVFL